MRVKLLHQFVKWCSTDGRQAPNQSRRTLLDIVPQVPTENMWLNSAYVKYFMALRDIPKQPEEGAIFYPSVQYITFLTIAVLYVQHHVMHIDMSYNKFIIRFGFETYVWCAAWKIL
jgi:hypothetical protein